MNETLKRVKWGNIILVVVAIVLLGFGGYKLYSSFYPSDSTFTSTETEVTSTQRSSSQDVPTPTYTSTSAPKTVSVSAPDAPRNGKKRGVAMLGGSGVFLYIVETDGENVTLISRDLKKELVKEGLIATDDIRGIVNGYITEMQNAGVTGNENFQFVVASSAMGDDKVKKIVEELKKRYTVTITTPNQEGYFAARVAIPQRYRDSSFLVDVTPTLTRLTWFEGSTTKTVVLLGSKALVDGKSEADVVADTVAKVRQIPQANRKNGYIIWAAMEKQSASERYTPLADDYQTTDKNYLGGLTLLQTVRRETGADMFFDSKSAFPMGFLLK